MCQLLIAYMARGLLAEKRKVIVIATVIVYMLLEIYGVSDEG